MFLTCTNDLSAPKTKNVIRSNPGDISHLFSCIPLIINLNCPLIQGCAPTNNLYPFRLITAETYDQMEPFVNPYF